MASGSKKICKHKLVGGDGRELPDFLPLLKTRVEQRIAAPVKLPAIPRSRTRWFLGHSPKAKVRSHSRLTRWKSSCPPV
jgi:hypothetical protein